MSTKLTLDQKLIAIYKSIDFIPKAGKNTAQSYNYVRAADVSRAVRAALADNGIYAEINIEQIGTPYTIARAKDKDAPFSAINVRCSVVLHDTESGDIRTASAIGSGADLGDKAAYKAETGALKYALRNALLIPDEEGDPEADESVDRAAAEPAPVKSSRPKQNAPPPPASAEEPEIMPPAAEIPPFVPEGETPAQAAAAVRDTPAVHQREPGDESEADTTDPADDGTLPTEEEKNEYRVRFNKIVDNLSSSKSLSASKGLKVEKKVVVFLLTVTGAARTGDVTRVQWLDFLARAEAYGAKENGWSILAKKINAANGIETSKK